MASPTLVQSAVLSQDLLIQGIIENIITVNRFFEVLPFAGIEGNALAYNRELVAAGVQLMDVGDTIVAGKTPATYAQVTSTLTTILGDAEVNGLIQATRSNINDQTAAQVASKAKEVGRQYQNLLINGTGVAPEFDGLLGLVDAAQIIPAGAGAATAALTLALLDQGIDLVTDKDGEVDFITMHARSIRQYYALLRALGGASIGDTVTLPSGTTVPAYRGIPIFRNDFIPINQTVGGSTDGTTILFGTLDDGSQMHGIGGLTASLEAGIVVQPVGVAETRDEVITRIKWYSGLALYSLLGLSAVTEISA